LGGTGFKMSLWGTWCKIAPLSLRNTAGRHYEAWGSKLIVFIALTGRAFKSGMQGVCSRNLKYVKRSLILAEHSQNTL
jgi:hypothetical protein